MELQGKKMNSAFLVDAGLLCNKDPITDATMGHNKMTSCTALSYTTLYCSMIL